MDNNENNLNRDQVEDVGEGIGAIGGILVAIGAAVVGVIKLMDLISGDKD